MNQERQINLKPPMNAAPNIQDSPSELADALARIDQAKKDYISLGSEMEVFLYEYVKGMIKSDPKSGDFALQFRHPRDSQVSGTPQVLVTQIAENLRIALDYMVFRLSALNEPNLNERVPQFVIADSESDFRHQDRRLRYLTDEQKGFIEQIQPYHGNDMLALLRTMTNEAKHRRLLSVRDNTGLDIYFADMTKREEYRDCFLYPLEEGNAVFAKPKGDGVVVLMEKYNAMTLLREMIGHAEDILRASYCFFQGRPFNLTIVRGDRMDGSDEEGP